MMKKSILLPIITLAVTALVLFGCAFGLQETANKNAQAEHLRILQTLLPESETFTVEAYDGEDTNIRSIHKGETGYVIETATQGYAGEIVLLVGVSNEGSVTGLMAREMHETMGLGNEALTDWKFLAQFLKNTGDAEVGTNVDGITGATVTSKAVARCVNSAVAFVTGADVDTSATSWEG